MNWITTHYSDIFAAAFGLIVVANIIVKLTPTPKDDSIVASIHSLISKVAGFLNVKEPAATQDTSANPTKPA